MHRCWESQCTGVLIEGVKCKGVKDSESIFGNVFVGGKAYNQRSHHFIEACCDVLCRTTIWVETTRCCAVGGRSYVAIVPLMVSLTIF